MPNPWEKYRAPDTPTKLDATPWDKYGDSKTSTEVRSTLPDYLIRMLKEGGVSESDRVRLTNTGITPGTAAEFAAAHIQMNKRQGQEVDEPTREAIFDIYKRESGRTDLSNIDQYARTRQAQLEAREQTVGGRLLSAGAGLTQSLGTTGTSVLGIVAPKTAAGLQEGVEATYATAEGSRAGLVGQGVGELVKLVATAPAGLLGAGAIYGAQGFGGQRVDVARQRAAGEDVSISGEFATATGIGVVEGISGAVGLKIARTAGGLFRSLSPVVQTGVLAGETSAIKTLLRGTLTVLGTAAAEGTEEGIVQIIQNKIKQQIDPTQAIMEGVKEAAIMGAILGPVGGLAFAGPGVSPTSDPNNVVDSDTIIEQRANDPGKTEPVAEKATVPITPQVRAASEKKTLEEVVEEAAKHDPDAATDADAVQPMQDFFTAQAQETLENPDGPFVKVDVPLSIIDENPEYQNEVRDKYASQPAGTSPAGMAGIGKGADGKFVVIDGNTRVHAAKKRGDTTVKMWVPEADARVSNLRGEIGRFEERRAAERKASRDEIQRMFEEGDVDGAQSAIANLQEQARRDPKGTGLLSGQTFDEDITVVQQEVDNTGESRFFSVLDVANLGLANTVRGHQEADADLQRVANAVLQVAGPEASYRTGGDEQGIIWPSGTTREQADQMMKQVEDLVGFDEIVPGASLFVAGGTGKIKPGGSIQATVQEVDKSSEVRKRQIKKERRERANISKDKAAKLAARIERGQKSASTATPIEGTSHARRIPRSVEDWITPISSRIRDISSSMFDRIMRMEFNTNVARERMKKELHDPTARLSAALRSEGKEADFKYHVLNQEFDQAKALVEKLDPKLGKDFDEFVTTFRNLLANQRDAGVSIGQVDNYWPRFIRDYNALKTEHGEDLGQFETAWELARKTLGRKEISSDLKAEIANNVIQGYGPRKPGSLGPPSARQRRVKRVRRRDLKHYIDPFEAAFRYVDGATYAAERARFLGKNHTPDNLDETIGSMIQEEVDAGRLGKEAQDELHDLLSTRFTADMLTTNKKVRNFKQLVYMVTLGQFRSSLTQLTDAAMTAAEHGLPYTIGGIRDAVRLTPRDRRIVMEDIGVHDHGEEFKDIGKVARATDWVFRRTGFKALDRLGKETRINAALRAFTAAVAKPASEGYAKLERNYRAVLGDASFDQVVRDLQAGKKTEDVKYLLFLDITKVQPITTSQMPARYLQMPNGRIIYTLKTFTLIQMDHVRRDMVRKIATPGQRKEGLSHLSRYLTFFTLLGLGVDMLKELLKGRLPDPDELPDQAIDALLGAVGLNRYTVEKAWTSPTEAAMNYITPPLSWLDAGWQDLTSDAKGFRSIRNIPIVGELMYYWAPFGRGYNLNAKEAKTDYRGKLKELRAEAAKALAGGDPQGARHLMGIYNMQRRQGPGDGRKTPITFGTLRSDISGGRGIARADLPAAARKALLAGDRGLAKSLLDAYNRRQPDSDTNPLILSDIQ